MLIFVGAEEGDDSVRVERAVEKVLKLRIFGDSAGKMNLNLEQSGGSVLVVSQFTLCADLSQGNRPGFKRALRPDLAKILYEEMIAHFKSRNIDVASGQFGADMKVSLINDGPATFYLTHQDFA